MGTRVFVGGLHHRVRETDLERFFRHSGRIKEIAMKNGFAFVEFDDYRDADDAIYEMNGRELMGERVSVERARGIPRGSDQWRGIGRNVPRQRRDFRDTRSDKYGPPKRTKHRIRVENLSSAVSWQDLKDYLRQAGEVTYADAHRDRKNEGIVEFASYSDMKNCIEKLSGTELNGRKIWLIEVNRSRSASRSASRSSSRSRSRSKSRRSRSKSRRSRTKSRSPAARADSKQRSVTPEERSRSGTPVKRGRSRSRSGSKTYNRKKSRGSGSDRRRSRSASNKRRSDSRSPKRSKSRTPQPEDSNDRKNDD